jgi:hypothetical protein
MITGDHEKGCAYHKGMKCDCILTNKLREMISCWCRIENRLPGEPQREWLKRCMCLYHWMETDYYRAKLEGGLRGR